MKKIIAISLVAILAVGSVFAAISGSVTTSAGYNLDTKEYGFFSVDNENAKIVLDLSASTADTTPVATEESEVPSIYGYVKASLSVKATIGKDTLGTTDNNIDSSKKTYYGENIKEDGTKEIVGKDVTTPNPYFDFTVTEAGVVGENWSLSILGTPSAPSFAKSFLDLDGDGKLDDDYEVPYYGANGLEATVYGYKVGLGAHGAKDKGLSATAFVQTPDYEIIDGLTASGAVAYSHRAAVDEADVAPGYGEYATIKSVSVDKDGKKTYDYEKDNWEIKEVKSATDPHNLAFSGKVGYATDLISATVSADAGVKNIKADDRAFGIDVAANVKYDFVTVDAYYAFKDTLNLQVGTDLNSFDVPVKLTVGVSNVATDSRNLYGSVEGTVAGFTAKVTGKVDLKTSPAWEFGVEGSYTVEDIAKIAASVSYNSKEWLGASISAENTTLIPGATLSLGWYDATDLLQKNNGEKFKAKQYRYAAKGSTAKSDADLDKAEKEADHYDFGVIKASVKIAF